MRERSQFAAVVGLFLLGLVATAGSVLLAAEGRPVPEPLIALAGVCVGALATFSVMNGPKPH